MTLRNYFKTLLLLILSVFCACNTTTTKKEREETHTNQLIQETSPYLLKHAHNPVNWQPWSPDAFETARQQNKLVLISVGYTSCHWCTVMEEETFSNDTVARFMNNNFITIKVDREERPDIDQLYMTALQLMTGSGGWPLNIITLPNGEPIYGGTYHTKTEWLTALKSIDSIHNANPEKTSQYAQEVTKRIQALNEYTPGKTGTRIPDKESITANLVNWQKNWDQNYGGNTGSQKFMLPSTLCFLMDYATLYKEEKVRDFIELSLDNIALKGVYDHLGGGFFRYSTDERWENPHFEKMLYDNAQMLSVYAKAYKLFKKPLYKKRLVETIAFLNRDLSNDSGVFMASLDADLDSKEGAFYTFTQEEISKSITTKPELFEWYYGIKSQKKAGKTEFNLFKTQTDANFSKENNLSLAALQELNLQWSTQLRALRAQRKKPFKDDKIVVGWNALAIKALTEAFAVTTTQSYLQQAEESYQSLMKDAWNGKNLVHSYKLNSKPLSGFLDDYTYLASASLRLYTLTGKVNYLKDARLLTETALEKFTVKGSPLLKYTSEDNLISPLVTTNDGVLPSGNAVMAENLFLLSNILYEDKFKERAAKMVTAIIPDIKATPTSYAYWESLQLNFAFPFYDVALVGENSKALALELQSYNLPNTLILFNTSENTIPIFEDRWRENQTLIYICEQRSCKYPVETVEETLDLLNY